MKDLRSYHNALGPQDLADLINDPANFTVVDSTAAAASSSTRILCTAPPGAGAG